MSNKEIILGGLEYIKENICKKSFIDILIFYNARFIIECLSLILYLAVYFICFDISESNWVLSSSIIIIASIAQFVFIAILFYAEHREELQEKNKENSENVNMEV